MIKNGSVGFSIFVSAAEEMVTCSKDFTYDISSGKLYPKPFHFSMNGKDIYILGAPIWQNKVDRESVAKLCLCDVTKHGEIKEINGTFLLIIIDKEHNTAHFITDRFGYISFFYKNDEKGFYGSTCYSDIWSFLKNENRSRINPLAFYEFIHFQKLLGTKTFDQETACLESASVLTINVDHKITLSKKKYWQPSYRKNNASVLGNAQRLSYLLKASYKKYTSDNLRYGLLLSGGLDSRAILASSDGSLPCFTVGEYENNECEVANLLADIKGCDYHFVKRERDHYVSILKSAVRYGSSMNTFDHAHFLGLDGKFAPYRDVFFHGHGLDYFFQGIYLPSRNIKFIGRPTYLKRLKALGGNFAETFYNNVKYRLKDLDSLQLLKKTLQNEAKDFALKSVTDMAELASKYSCDEYDIWEYLHIFNLSRHYTHLNVESLRSFSEERCIAFENDLFDLYLSMPVEHRFGGQIFKKAIGLMNPGLLNVRNANSNISALYTPIQSTILIYLNKTMKRITKKSLFQDTPSIEDRSWPDRDMLIREHEGFYQRAENLGKSERLDSLGIFDMDFINDCVGNHLNSNRNYGALIVTLLTIDQFLSL